MALANPGLFDELDQTEPLPLDQQLREFRWNGKSTETCVTAVDVGARPVRVETFVNEFWTSKQRAAHSLHEVSYRACFKPQLPRFFIERLTRPGETVYDPFMGRGTTVLEAALLSRVPAGCDVNPLSRMLVGPRLAPPSLREITERLSDMDWSDGDDQREDLLTFYHPDTLREMTALRKYLIERASDGTLDPVDDWIRMVAVNRLTGHSTGFFSVYTLPPNQAVSVAAQKKINTDRNQTPPRREVPKLIIAKSRSLLQDHSGAWESALRSVSRSARLITSQCAHTPELASGEVSLVVTSPPFLDVVDYAGDNWLRDWFCAIDASRVNITILKRVEQWRAAMAEVFLELARVLRPGGHIAFEVGEVRGGKVKLEEHVIPCGMAAGLSPMLVVINAQEFTKTAACWGVSNNSKGTNTNRIVVFRKN